MEKEHARDGSSEVPIKELSRVLKVIRTRENQMEN